MSMAWEVTEDDVSIVLQKHGIVCEPVQLSENHSKIDVGEVESNVLYYSDMDDQANAALCSIENQLIEQGIIPGPKEFFCP